MRYRARLVAPPLLGAWITAMVFWWLSLGPTLLPRTWVQQSAISALCTAIGFGVGSLLHRLVRRVLRWRHVEIPPDRRRTVVMVLRILAVVAWVIGLWWWFDSQQSQARLVFASEQAAWSVLPLTVLTVLLTAVLLVIGRSIAHVVLRWDRVVARRLPVVWARWTVTISVAIAAIVFVRLGVIALAEWADESFGAFDDTTEEDVERPTTANASGGPGSLVRWEDLGLQGRTFTGRTPTAEDIAAFAGPDAMEPIRVYVGLDSAPTVGERVQLAVEELERTRAFEREVLVVVTPTGTGWVDPDAARTIEHMYGGDTAIVSVQYSFLPSWIAFVVDTGSPTTLGEALFAEVWAAWNELPADSRPELVVFGESLGSMSGEAGFAGGSLHTSLRRMTSLADAALFTGPTRGNPVFGRLIDERDPGTPSWRPEIAAEPNVRVVNDVDDIVAEAGDASWAEPRLLWVHHPSDAIGTFQGRNLLVDPGWAEDPGPADVPSAARWFPVVSFVQELFDLMNGFSAAPGFGHDYRTDFAHAWTAIVPPDGWTFADADRLREHLGL